MFRIRFHWVRIRIQHLRLNSHPDPGFLWLKIGKNLHVKKNLIFFWSKIAIYLSLGLHKRRPSYRRSLQPSKDNIQIQHFKKWEFLIFLYFCGSFLPSWIQIRIHGPYRIRIQSGPGSKTLLQRLAVVPWLRIQHFWPDRIRISMSAFEKYFRQSVSVIVLLPENLRAHLQLSV